MFRQLISHTCIPGQNTCQYFHVHKNTDTYHLHHNTKMFHKAEKSCISNALQIWKSHNTHNNSSLQTQGHSSVKIETLLWVVRGENVETETFERSAELLPLCSNMSENKMYRPWSGGRDHVVWRTSARSQSERRIAANMTGNTRHCHVVGLYRVKRKRLGAISLRSCSVAFQCKCSVNSGGKIGL